MIKSNDTLIEINDVWETQTNSKEDVMSRRKWNGSNQVTAGTSMPNTLHTEPTEQGGWPAQEGTCWWNVLGTSTSNHQGLRKHKAAFFLSASGSECWTDSHPIGLCVCP